MKSYTVKELALAYFPDATPKYATTQLRIWIVNDPNLINLLAKAGHSKGQKILTPYQAQLIVSAFGEPDCWEQARKSEEREQNQRNQKKEIRGY